MEVRGWPVRLVDGDVVLRPIRRSDGPAWREVRERNAEWLQPWDATAPPSAAARPTSYGQLVRQLHRRAREGVLLPFAIEVEGQFAGQITVSNIVRGSAQFASIGYWLDSRWAGRGVMPTSVAMVIDHCFREVGLHRIEVSIRPENTNSLRVVEKLGLREIGYAPRYLHIDGDWRDHRMYAVTVEECPEGMLTRLRHSETH